MQSRMKNPAAFMPQAVPLMQQLGKLPAECGVPEEVLELSHLRASQINGCSVCVDLTFRFRKGKPIDERLFAVAAWRDAPFFSDAERAALALTEALTRLADREDAVPDAIWNEAARHFDEKALAGLVLSIAMTNVWNRRNVATKQIAGEWAKSFDASKWTQTAAA